VLVPELRLCDILIMDKRIDALFDIEREINGLAADERLMPAALAFDLRGDSQIRTGEIRWRRQLKEKRHGTRSSSRAIGCHSGGGNVGRRCWDSWFHCYHIA
jgi:hypothetical protein